MSGFGEAWLSLREPLDAASRDGALVGRLVAAQPKRPLAVIDLAAGTGANLRYLAPRLGGPQHWRLIDHDDALLDAIPARLRQWVHAIDATIAEHDDGTLVVQGPAFECRIERIDRDLARGIESLDVPRHALVTASALLDLVSAPWLEALARRCRHAEASALFALTYDGRIELTPQDPLDATVIERVNRHQRIDKGFGPALGPTAADRAAAVFAQQGYHVERARSDWRIDARHRPLQEALLADWSSAASAMSPDRAAALEDWARRRARLVRDDARLLVGHDDLLARLPTG